MPFPLGTPQGQLIASVFVCLEHSSHSLGAAKVLSYLFVSPVPGLCYP